MARGIKGLVVEIGGDTSGLQKALQQAKTASTNLTTELNKVNKSLKLDTKNPELLAQKQKVLNESIEKTSTYLEQLKKHEKDVLESGIDLTGKNAEKYRALQREIVEVQKKLDTLKSYKSGLLKLGEAATEFGNKIKSTGEHVTNLGNKLSKLSVPAIAGLTGTAKAAIDFEDAFAGVRKTVDATEDEFKKLEQGIKDMAKEVPSTTTEIANVAEAAGQLGIKKDDVLSFTKTMIDLGNSTNLSATEAASALAKFANITGTSSKDFNKLGSVIVELGNNFATTESDIVTMATRLASTGELVGLTEPQIFALATAMSSVGIEAEAGGTAMSKLLKQIQVSVETGSDDLKQFAKVAGVSVKDFKKAYEEDAVKALTMFIKGLKDTERNGKSAVAILDDMDIKEVRLSNTILSLSNSSDVMTEAIDRANKAWKEDTALTNEANKRYQTTASKLKITWNEVKNVAINLGNKLLPIIKDVLEKISNWLGGLEKLNDEQLDTIVKIGLIVAAAGPLLKIFGTLTSGIGSVVKGFGTFTTALGVMKTGVESSNKAANSLAKGLSALTSPAGLAATAITIAVGIMIAQIQKAKEEHQKQLKEMSDAFGKWGETVSGATNYLNGFNTTLFASNEEQQKLATNMSSIQGKITQICKTATEQRRGLTDNEIKKVKEYLKQLEELSNKELQLQQSIGGAIEQQAKTSLETFNGTAEQFKVKGSEWISTAESQKNRIVEIANQRATEEIALLNQTFGDRATLENEEYAKELKRITDNKEKIIKEAEDQVGRTYTIVQEGYNKRISESNTFKDKYNKYLSDITKAEEEYNKTEKGLLGVNANAVLEYAKKIQNSWDENMKSMSKAEKEEVATWLEMVANTELYGGQISEEDQKMVDTILQSWEKMDDESKKTMSETMSGMLKGMQDKEPSLFSQASGIANGIISRLRKSFDVNSPSRVMRKLFGYVGEGAVLGLKDEESAINKEINKIAESTMGAFETPQIAQGKLATATGTQNYNNIELKFYPQTMTDAELDKAFNYVNRKLGTAY